MRKQKDILWKGALEQLFEDFLLFINPDLAGAVDMTKGFEFLNKELNQEFPSDNGKFEQKIVDKLVRLHLQDGSQILLHLEVQEKYSKDFGERMYGYFNRLYRRYKIPITAYAIFTEQNEINRANTFDIDFMGTIMNYQFNICKIALLKEDDLLKHSNCFALIVLIAKAAFLKKKIKNRLAGDELLLAYKLKMVKLILEKKLPASKERVIMKFLFYYADFDFSEIRIKFDHEVNLLINKNSKNMITIEDALFEYYEIAGFQKGKKEGKKEGQARGEAKGEKKAKEDEVYRLITILGFSDQQIADYAGVPLKFAKRIRTKLNASNLIH
ncbi:hypothetical protein [Pedobacter sp. L105]|uniref:hypothetical protein n=1 Tax=Pedobacter sp. L105 TaxID=1641871 RepID=UPI00131E1EBC|nr:hypothetical protein [Pedobacter sp. L105]